MRVRVRIRVRVGVRLRVRVGSGQGSGGVAHGDGTVEVGSLGGAHVVVELWQRGVPGEG